MKKWPVILILLSLCTTVYSQETSSSTTIIKSTTTITTTNGAEAAPTEPPKPIYYELVQDNLKPEPDEFYVDSIFTIQGKPKASIARSQNKRAGELYDSYVTYGIGDYIAEGLKIHDIDIRLKEVVVVKEATQEYYVLTISYGTATSRLIKINYQPKK